MHAIARFSAESVRLSGVSATGNSFVRSVEFPVNRMVNERTRETNRFGSFVLKTRSFEPVRERTSQQRACVFLPARVSMAEPLRLKTLPLTWASVSLPLYWQAVCVCVLSCMFVPAAYVCGVCGCGVYVRACGVCMRLRVLCVCESCRLQIGRASCRERVCLYV